MKREFLDLADTWIARTADVRGLAWYRDAQTSIAATADSRTLAIAIGQAPRRLGRNTLGLTAADVAKAQAIRPNLDPTDWRVDELARIALMLASHRDDDNFAVMLDRFCATAEINEAIAIYRGLPVYPAATLIEPRAREAVRSGMKPVFEAVAHRNPYPGDMFAEHDWNQMVVKAIFVGASLWPIQRLDARNNPQLARMLVALAHEREAAGRPISGEIWRCVVPHADREAAAALQRAWTGGTSADRRCIALSLQASPMLAASLPFADALHAVQTDLQASGAGWPDLV